MTPGDSAASGASDIQPPQAADLAVIEELQVLWELWRLAGCTVDALPPRSIIRRATWAEAWLAAQEGRRPRIPADHAMWFYLDPPYEGCGVAVFLPG